MEYCGCDFRCQLGPYCRDNPCKNSGKCIDSLDGPVCECEAGFQGDRCVRLEFRRILFSSHVRFSALCHPSHWVLIFFLGVWVMWMSASRTPAPTEDSATTHTARLSVTARWVSAATFANSIRWSVMSLSPLPGTLAWRKWSASWSLSPASSYLSCFSSLFARRLAAASQRRMTTNIQGAPACPTPSSTGRTLIPNSTKTSTQTSLLRCPCGPSPTRPAFRVTRGTTWTETPSRAQPSQNIQSSPPSTRTPCTDTARRWPCAAWRPISPLPLPPTLCPTATPSRSQTGTMIMTVSLHFYFIWMQPLSKSNMTKISFYELYCSYGWCHYGFWFMQGFSDEFHVIQKQSFSKDSIRLFK